ncbi:MAG TPA: AAA family ATPase [Dokdonella sp.]|uniref:AAA family ATPase n=1 Tax=Dokdonella sp. TaxID=2291710 RepID=UPI002D7EEABB|nr:AAA family ATPase [Dokdonella sp.]HET9032452.1 AAA family ATPase [Dokdonella sp.]
MTTENDPSLASPAGQSEAASLRSAELAPRPFVIATMGLPGAGKSIVARAIEDHLGLRRVCRDQIRAAMFPRCNFSYIEKRAAFRSLLLALDINCMIGVGSVIDGMTFSRRSELDRVAGVADKHGIVTIPLLIDCPVELARERVARDLAANRHLAGDRTPDTVNDVMARREPAPEGTLVVDATLPAAQMCREAIALLRKSIAAAALSRA